MTMDTTPHEQLLDRVDSIRAEFFVLHEHAKDLYGRLSLCAIANASYRQDVFEVIESIRQAADNMADREGKLSIAAIRMLSAGHAEAPQDWLNHFHRNTRRYRWFFSSLNCLSSEECTLIAEEVGCYRAKCTDLLMQLHDAWAILLNRSMRAA